MYQAIDTDDAFKILKKYYPDADKGSFLKDVKSRHGKFTKQYTIWSTGNNRIFIIADEYMANDDIDALFDMSHGKPFYTPETINKFLFHSSFDYWKQTNINEYKQLEKILSKKKNDDMDLTFNVIFDDLKTGSYVEDVDPLTMTFRRLMVWGYEFEINEGKKVLDYLSKIINNTRIPANHGYTPKELRKLSGPVDPNKISLTLGPNIKRMLEDGELDINEYIQGVISSNIPENAKRTMLEELKRIKNNIEKAQA